MTDTPTNTVSLSDEDVETATALIVDARERQGDSEALDSLAAALDMKVRSVPPEERTVPVGPPAESESDDDAVGVDGESGDAAEGESA